MNATPVPTQAPSRLGYLVLGRILPLLLFALLLVGQAMALAPDIGNAVKTFPRFEPTMLAVNRVLQVLFVGGIALIYLVRKPAVGRQHQPLAVAVAFYASFILLAARLLQGALGIVSPTPTTGALVASDILVGAGLVFSAYSLFYLRWSFSIIPEARELITGGPYRLVRHPIYFGEIITGLGVALGLATWFAFVLWLSMVLGQLLRIRYEEDVLTRTFGEYSDYARRTKRLIPWLV